MTSSMRMLLPKTMCSTSGPDSARRSPPAPLEAEHAERPAADKLVGVHGRVQRVVLDDPLALVLLDEEPAPPLAPQVAVLDLLLHRAITEEVPANVRTWTFHLPDIGTYDFTEGCTEADGVWSGENCGGARLQEWLIDVDRRLVSAGLVRWTRPGDLEQP